MVRSLRGALEDYWQNEEQEAPRTTLQNILNSAQKEHASEEERAARQKAESDRVHVEYKQFTSAFEAIWQFNTTADSVDWLEWARRWRHAAQSLTVEMQRQLRTFPASLNVPTFQATKLILLDSDSSLESMAETLHAIAGNPRLASFARWLPTLQNWLFPPPTIDTGAIFLTLAPVAELGGVGTTEEIAEVRKALLGYPTESKPIPNSTIQEQPSAVESEAPQPEADEKPRKSNGKTKKPNPWHDAGSSPPMEFAFGPLTGQKKQLSRWILNTKDHRALNTSLRNGSFWGRADVGACKIWFKDQKRYAEANTRKLNDERGETF